jgi:hypothetical protein
MDDDPGKIDLPDGQVISRNGITWRLTLRNQDKAK